MINIEAKESPRFETYTYYDESSDDPVEVLLLGVESDQLGTKNDFHPPGFNRHHISTWMRKNYFFLDGTVYAQVPRRAKEYPDEAKKSLDFEDGFATDVTVNEEKYRVFYSDPQSSIVLSWDVLEDYWTMCMEDIPVRDGNIEISYIKDEERIWSSE